MPTLLKMRVPPPTDWSEFEDITKSALKVKWRSSDLQRFGRQGQKQDGVDVYGHDDMSRFVGVQCRNKDQSALKITEVSTAALAAEKFKSPLAAFYMATTLGRDAKLQADVLVLSKARVAENKFPIGVFFWEDLYEELVGDTAEFAKHYPQLVPQQPTASPSAPLTSAAVVTQVIDPALKKFHRACQEVYAFAHDLTAGMNTHPDTDWGEVCEMIAFGFSGYEQQLSEMIKEYGMYLDKTVIASLEQAFQIASNGKHHVQFIDGEGLVVDAEGSNLAEEFNTMLGKAAEEARADLRKKAGLD